LGVVFIATPKINNKTDMKKITFLSTLFLSTLGFAQISLFKHDMSPIVNGQVVAFNTATYPASELDFYIKNNSTSTVNVKVNCMSLINNDGTGFELCFGPECLSSVEEGTSYPSSAVTLAPNGMNGNFDHFLNTNAGSGVFPKDYVFRFYQVGNPTGNTIDFTYRYDPNLTTEQIEQLQTSGVVVKSTVVENSLEFDVLKSTNFEIFDLNGKLVMNTTKLEYGLQSIDISNLSSGVYVINFTSNEGNTSKKKFCKK
jgi:hypothetical protein